MKSIVPVRPELDGVGDESIATPERRQRNLFLMEAALGFGDASVEIRSVFEGPRLRRCPGGKLARPWSGVPVRGRLVVCDLHDVALGSDLAAQLPPVEHQRGSGILPQLVALLRFPIREERQPAFVDPAQQHDPSRGPAARVRCRQRHGIGLGHSRTGVYEPRLKPGDRVVAEIAFVHGSQDAY